jgi:hypothetical protein
MNCLSFLLAVSMHVGLENNYNMIHPHIRCQQNETIGGVYYNSRERASLYVGREYILQHFNVELGLVSGYEKYPVVPLFRLKKDIFFIAPAYELDGRFGAVLGIEYKFK